MRKYSGEHSFASFPSYLAILNKELAFFAFMSFD